MKPNFFLVWFIVIVLYPFFFTLMGFLQDGVDGLVRGAVMIPVYFTEATTFLGLAIIALLFAIPAYLTWYWRYEKEQTDQKEAIDSSDDMAGEAEGTIEQEHYVPITSKNLHTQLWVLFVVLFITISTLIFFAPKLQQVPSPLYRQPVQQTVTTTPVVEEKAKAAFGSSLDTSEEVLRAREEVQPEAPTVDISLLPKFGEYPKTPDMIEADEAFVQGILSMASSTEEALRQAVARGWKSLRSGDTDMAMRRFNQAWLISTTSADILWGMAAVEGARGNYESSIELFEEALTYDGTQADMYCDFATTYMGQATQSTEPDTDLLEKADETYLEADSLGIANPNCYIGWSQVARKLDRTYEALLYEEEAAALLAKEKVEIGE